MVFWLIIVVLAIRCKYKVFSFSTGAYGSPYAIHSLSWSRNKENVGNGVMHAKVWTPETPSDVSLNHSPNYSVDSHSNSSQFE